MGEHGADTLEILHVNLIPLSVDATVFEFNNVQAHLLLLITRFVFSSSFCTPTLHCSRLHIPSHLLIVLTYFTMSRPEDFLMDDDPEEWMSNPYSSDPPHGMLIPFLVQHWSTLT